MSVALKVIHNSLGHISGVIRNTLKLLRTSDITPEAG